MCHVRMRSLKKVSNQTPLILTYLLTLDVTWADVKRQLAVEDHFEVEGGSLSEDNITPSAFVVAALELEEAQ
jgi:hypothetical protein